MPPRPAARWTSGLALAALALPGSAPAGGPGPTNGLAGEPSPYLQLHARNPVDWHPWGEEAFERARAEDKPVFLSVGYSTCHWCHVMEREVFSDPEIAAQLNAGFVSIKVDREERPDIDHVYMRATQLMTGAGGWPNSVFLTPDGRPFYAGTYFPPEDRHGQPGFPRVLDALHRTWTGEREKVIETASRVTRHLEELERASVGSREVPPLEPLLERALATLRADYDPEHGGFGRRRKFPRAPTLELLLARLERGDEARAREMLVGTLDAMALGGLWDPLGGGFHRYAVDRSWSIPHFEKMLYDNALLLGIYARAHALTGRPLYRRVVERTAAYLEREMSLAGGGFASAQDAEVSGVEGASYVWSREAIARVLSEPAATAWLAVYELAPLAGKPGHGVLRVRLPLSERLAESGAGDAAELLASLDAPRARLLEARGRRAQPRRDDKVLAAWNALAIRGLVEAAQALDEPRLLARAERAAGFLQKALIGDGGRLRRAFIAGRAREEGVLDDYAFTADAFLALHAATGDARWQAAAGQLADAVIARFEDREGGGFFLTPEGSTLLVRPKPFADDALPSGNGIALGVLRRLAAGTGATSYTGSARRAAAAAAPRLESAPEGLASTVAALAATPDPARNGLAEAAEERKAGAPPETAAPELRMPHSEERVQVSAVRRPDQRGLTVRVSMDEGWHVNANPASARFLIPTQVELPGSGEGAVIRYPEGRAFSPAFAPEPIQVYAGSVEIEVSLTHGDAPPERVSVRYQACDERRCLSPTREEVAVATREEPEP